MKVKIKNLQAQNKAKEILQETRNQLEKDVDILVRGIKVKYRFIKQLNDKVTAIKSYRIPNANTNIESLVQHAVHDAKEQNVNITLMKSSTIKPPMFKCKYCGKKIFPIYSPRRTHQKLPHPNDYI